MCQKRDRRGTLERVETEREGVKTERGVHFLWQAQACGSVTCKEMVRYYFTFYVYVTGGASKTYVNVVLMEAVPVFCVPPELTVSATERSFACIWMR